MNSQIETWRVQAFAANVMHLSQQDGSKVDPFCRKESFVGKSEFFDRLGKATAQDKVGRNTDTPNLDIAHTRRMLVTATREWGTLVDRTDKLQNIHDPASEYAKAAAMALGRKRDRVLIEAAFGTVSSGEAGASSVVLPNLSKVTAVASTALAYPNLQLLKKAKRTLDANQVKGARHIFHSADFLEALLGETAITSSDYNAVKALVAGEVDSYLGFQFHMCQEIDSYVAATFDGATYKFNTTTGLYDSGGTALGGTEKVALCMAEGSLISGSKSGSFIARITEESTKGFSQQVYTAEDNGGLRMEDEAVLQLIYKA